MSITAANITNVQCNLTKGHIANRCHAHTAVRHSTYLVTLMVDYAFEMVFIK